MTDLSFRPAVKADLPSIIAMLADDALGQSREDASDPVNANYSSAFDVINNDSNQALTVALEGDDVIGCLQLTFIPGLSRLGMWRGQIESVRIARDKRGCGYGAKLFEWAIAECRKRGCGLVQLTTDKSRKDAYAFYESLGFSASHEGMKLGL